MIKFIIVIFGLLAASFAANSPFFRRDYDYNRDYNAFYKFHQDVGNLSYEKAVETCIGEGSKLFYPKLTEEWKILRRFIGLLNPDISEYILVGFYNEVGVGQLITVDGLPTPVPLVTEASTDGNCVYMGVDDGAIRIDICPPPEDLLVRGFVCKREIEEDQPCPTIDREYHYEKTTKKCYKLNKKAKSWLDAMTTCFMEGGSLLVTRNSDELEIIKIFLNQNAIKDERFYVGYRRSLYNNQFYTVKGESLVDGFYVDSSYNQINYDINSMSDCGTYVFSESRYLTNSNYPCELALPFICEISTN